MKTRPLGRTGIDVSEIIFGAGYTGGILILADEKTRRAALERALAAGINWIDTAAHYGNGQSEETIGRHLSSLSPRPMISTKVALTREDLADIPGAFERHVEQNLIRLKSDRVELLQLHNPVGDLTGPFMALSPDIVLRKGGVADAFDRIKSRGLTRAVGFTALGQARACIELIDSGRFQSAQVYYNMINPSAAWDKAPPGWSAQDFSGIIPACRRQGMAIMCIRAFAGGALTGAARHGREVVIDKGSDQAEEERRATLAHAAIGPSHGPPAQAALRFVLASPDVSGVVVGIGELEHIDDAVEASRLGPLPKSAIALIEALCAADFRRERKV